MNKKQAIERTEKLWKFLEETGKGKEDWPEWDKYGGIDNVTTGCFLCEYCNKYTSCESCPYHKEFGHCNKVGAPYFDWTKPLLLQEKKRCAKRFLEQLKEL